MSWRRLWRVAALDLRHNLRRPLYLFWALFMGWNGWLMSRGAWFYQSVDTSLGGRVAWVTSEFQVAYVMALLTFFLYPFFVAVAAGMPLIRDEELRVGEVLHATPLRPREYVWGKLVAALLSCGAMIGLVLASAIIFNYLLPDPERGPIYGPFSLTAFLRPALVFLLPATVFTAGAAFALGVWSRRPIVVFMLPVAFFFFFNQIYWGWFPEWLEGGLFTFFLHFDPSGFRWLKQVWLVGDRGIGFYNENPIGYSAGFLVSRVGWILAGLAFGLVAERLVARRLRAATSVGGTRRWWQRRAKPATPPPATPATASLGEGLGGLAMTGGAPGWLRSTLAVTRFELRELGAQPGLYLFLPIVFFFNLVFIGLGVGPFFTRLIPTSGTAAVVSLPTLQIWGGLLLLFYAVESLRREESTRLAGIYASTPVPTPAILAGKAVALGVVVVAVHLTVFLSVAFTIAQGAAPLELFPFALTWGLHLPTLIVWIAFVMLVYALTANRYTTYGIALAVLTVTVLLFVRGNMTWVTNWPLIGSLQWSDLGAFEIDRQAIVLNRLLMLALTALFATVTIFVYPRRGRDRKRNLGTRLRALPRLGVGATVVFTLLSVGLAFTLWRAVHTGFEGDAVRGKHERYWRHNLATWFDAPLPQITRVELDLELEPAARSFTADGWYEIENRTDEPLRWIPVTGGFFWDDLNWTWNGAAASPAEHEGLYVFQPATPLQPGARARLGFRYNGVMPKGVSRNGGQLAFGEFMLASGVVVTGRNPDFVPVLGYVPTIGIDDENRYEPQRFPPDFHEGITPSDIDRSMFHCRLRISAPAAYTVNSMGVKVAESEQDGRRTVVWESDYPVRVFNVIAGRWDVRRGNGTAVFHHPAHTHNIDNMVDALDAARRYFSAWYAPFPWQELRISEFPALAQYARGNPTNILFSEGIGFLTRAGDDGISDLAFLVTAHEAAHNWWGHYVSSGDGPGGIILSEGAAHFATAMLIEQVRGPYQRMRFLRGNERTYSEFRGAGNEKPLAETELYRPTDNTVVYDKGGWVLWMLMHHMGREPFLEGVRAFMQAYHLGPDHPVIQDFVATLRPYAPDTAAFDAFTKQWFFELALPEYQIMTADKRDAGNGTWTVEVSVRNAGNGRMPVDVAATAGRRFQGDGTPDETYQECRATLVLGAGEEKEATLRCGFEPERLTVDPDVMILQLQRRAASVRI